MKFGTTTDVPNNLLRLHEEGKVVFFCGAGISYDAGIPVFDGLLDKTADALNYNLSKAQRRLFKEGKYDQLYQSIELAVSDKKRVRTATAEILKPTKLNDATLSKHASILKLARTDDDRYHLVTTNFDELFDRAAETNGIKPPVFAAPLLPVPKRYKLNGLVYLHGKLKPSPTEDNLNSLILSSGDFGLAYLNERWASRFVSELFKEFTICFIGYSVNDVIIKYMMDALSSEVLLGADKKLVYAFSGVTNGNMEHDEENWEAKGIIPIQYRVTKKKGHQELNKILSGWASYYTSGRMGKSATIRERMAYPPDSISKEGKSQIERVQWALSDIIGAKALQYVKDENAENARHWIEYIPGKLLLDDKVSNCIISWIGSMMNCRESLQWCMRNEKHLLPQHQHTLFNCLDSIDSSNRRFKTIWHLYLAHFLYSEDTRTNFWFHQMKKPGSTLDAGMRQDFKLMIQPRLSLTPNVYFNGQSADPCRHFSHSIILGDGVTLFEGDDADNRLLSQLLPEITLALNDACAMQSELATHESEEDLSYWHIPSLLETKHINHGNDWCVLLVFIRNGFLQLLHNDRPAARSLLDLWKRYDHPAFFRVYLFAAAIVDGLKVQDTLLWLRKHPNALHFDNCARELYDFLDKRAMKFSADDSTELESMILNCTDLTDAGKATRLEHLKKGGAKISSKADMFLQKFSLANVQWASRNRVQDGIHIVDDSDELIATKTQNLIVASEIPDDPTRAHQYFISQVKRPDFSYNSKWSEYCQEHPKSSFDLLMRMGHECAYWDDRVWDVALENMRPTADAPKEITGLISVNQAENVPIALMEKTKLKLAFWMQALAKTGAGGDGLVELCRRFIMEANADAAVDGTENSNAPYELAMESILRVWFATPECKPGSGIPACYLPLLEFVVRNSSDAAVYARKEVLHQLSEFYQIDKTWTQQNLFPFLSWKEHRCPIDAWNFAVMTHRYVDPMMKELNDDFITTADHYLELDSFSRQWYCGHLFYRCTHIAAWDKKKTLTHLISQLPDAGRIELARQFYVKIESSGERADQLWDKELLPLLQSVWPGESRCMSQEVADHLVRSVIFLNEKFPLAVSFLKERLHDKPNGDHLAIHLLSAGEKGKASHCSTHPEASLEYLGMFSSFNGVTSSILRDCMNKISAADPTLESTRDFKKLQIKIESMAF